MSAPTLAQPGLVDAWRSARGIVATLALGLVALGLLFHEEIAAALYIWDTSTAYNHCFLVIPIAGYLIWDRRATLRGIAAQPQPLFALAGIPLALAWLLAERLGIMEGRQLVAMSFAEVLFLAVFGWRLWWALCGPLLYLYFLVPFGAFLTPKLQDLTTMFVRFALDAVQIPNYIDGYTIEIPEGTFYVAEACAGLRFLIAAIAFGVLYALLMYRSPLRRAVFIVVSIIVPIIANWIRAFGIVALGHLLGSAQAVAADHVLYGWIFFSLVILLLIALGLPFREDHAVALPQPASAPVVPGRWRGALLASAIVVVTAAISPVLATGLDSTGLPPGLAMHPLDFGPRCSDQPSSAPPALGTPGLVVERRATCDTMVLDVRVELFPTRSTAGRVLTEQRRVTAIPGDEDTETGWLPGQPRMWRFVRAVDHGPVIVTALVTDGRISTGGIGTRVRMAWSSVAGTSSAPVLVTVTPVIEWRRLNSEARQELQDQMAIVLQQPDLVAQIQRLGNSTPQ